MAATPQISATPENGLLSPKNSARAAKALYETAGPAICRMVRYMFRFPVELARMCGNMMIVNMYDTMWVVVDYVGIKVR